MILLIGSEGAQGKRYQAILKYLKREFISLDLESPPFHFDENELDGVIVASPTETHADIIREYIPLGLPILIEKPLSKSIGECVELCQEADKHHTPLTLVYQYRHLIEREWVGESYYNYFRHGKDGLRWDCLQIVSLAKGSVNLQETSPVWQCTINGHALNIADMDRAYVKEIEDWLSGRKMHTEEIIRIHEKTASYVMPH